MASLTLRTVKGSPLTNTEVDNNFNNINNELGTTFNRANTISSNVGVLSNLLTTTNSNTVNAINEVHTRTNNHTSNVSSNIGLLANLVTVAKSNVVSAINELNVKATTNVSISGGIVGNVLLSFIAVDDTTTSATYYPTFLTNSTGNSAVRISSTKLTFNPSSGLLTSTDYNSASDIQLKENISPIFDSLSIIDKLNGFKFTWKESGEHSYGLSAQDVEKIIPEIVKSRPDGYKGINYLNIIAFLVEAVKDLKKEIQLLKDKN